ncbi:Bcl-2-like protein 11 [Bagarius yarrelli]|uniref:Bcl-2-like protein 11 n=1 Tax=Bagarius yarrelli TaxID=175774 RepID=A0A556U714_BAGYA|nr:Bcl-2-like protein 11 [Bagarius yarrelli]
MRALGVALRKWSEERGFSLRATNKREENKLHGDLNTRQYRSDGPGFLKPPQQGECEESGSRAEQWDSAQPSELEVFYRGGIAVPSSRVVYQSRSPVFRTLSRSSSGYFSFDSEPSSPLITQSTATQTPSPASQVITHALQRISEARGDAHNHELWFALHNHYPPHGAASAGDMRAEQYIAHELRRIGDEFNQLYFHEAERNGDAAPRQAQNEPAIVLWIGFLIGRLLQFILRRR